MHYPVISGSLAERRRGGAKNYCVFSFSHTPSSRLILQKAKELERPAAVLVKEGFLTKRGGAYAFTHVLFRPVVFQPRHICAPTLSDDQPANHVIHHLLAAHISLARRKEGVPGVDLVEEALVSDDH